MKLKIYVKMLFKINLKPDHLVKGKPQESQGGAPAVDEEPQFKLNFSLNLNVKPDHLV